jgi:serine/threonine-protein kinase
VVLGKLRIERTLGSGGMGVVYEVEHEITKHRRALKILHLRAAVQPGIVERFLREASAAGRIGNPHVTETFDAGRLETGEPYLLMELVSGETLDQRLARLGPLDPGELADMVYQACEGVQAAHDAGIVHRDLKPENLIITMRDGAPFVKILDFGISKFDADRTGTLGITTEGLVMGTPYYMSPEQVRGMTVDARSDVYALGVILYECASGVRPYDARSIEALAVVIHEGLAVPLQERRPSLPPAFCAVVHRAMATHRAARFESSRALGEALAPMRVRTLHAPVRTSPPPRAVVRPSSRPSAQGGDGPPSSLSPHSEAALAATMGSGAVPRQSGRRSVPLLGIGAAILTAGAAGAFAWMLHVRASAPNAPVERPADVAPASATREPPPAQLAPLDAPVSAAAPSSPEPLRRVAPPTASPQGTRPDAGGLSTSASIPGAPAATGPASALAPPSAKPAAKSRVDQTGLAGENPFQ